MERERTWAKEKSTEKADTNRVNAEAMESARAEAEERVREKTNDFQMSEVEAAAKIRSKAEA